MPRLTLDVSMDTLRKLNNKYGTNKVPERLADLAEADVADNEETGHTMERQSAPSNVEGSDKASSKFFC